MAGDGLQPVPSTGRDVNVGERNDTELIELLTSL